MKKFLDFLGFLALPLLIIIIPATMIAGIIYGVFKNAK